MSKSWAAQTKKYSHKPFKCYNKPALLWLALIFLRGGKAVFPMYIAYIDDSRDELYCCFTALLIKVEKWKECFYQIKEFRSNLKSTDDISVHSEFHAWKFVSGRGRLGTNRVINKTRRCEIFRETLELVAGMPDAKVISVCLSADKENWAFERLLNRIERNMKSCGGNCLLICDEGKDAIYTRLCRKMSVVNFIQSRYGAWEDGKSYKSITIDHIIEDPIFKDSKKSYFVQLADFCAYALLRQEHHLPSKNAFGLHQMYRVLEPICVKKANPNDPQKLGIVR